MCQVEFQDIVSGCRGVHVEETYVYKKQCTICTARVSPSGEQDAVAVHFFLLFFQHYNKSLVKVNEDVLMATREKILLEEVSTLP